MSAASVLIRGIAAGGDGVGTLEDGRTVFVPRAAPGDLIELSDLRLHRRFARGRVGHLVEAGPDRVAPRCTHYDADGCGGCQLQHLEPDAQRKARSAIVGDTLRRIARRPVEDPVVAPAPDDWGYRTRITLAVVGGGRTIGFHRYDRPTEVFDLRRCEIAAPALQETWSAVSAVRSLLPGGLTHLSLRLDRRGGRHLVLEPATTQAWAGATRLHAELLQRRVAVTIWWRPPGGAPRTLAGADEAFPATVFEQVNPIMGDMVRVAAVEALGEVAGTHVWDLYAGIGETTRALALGGATVESVELDRRAVALAESRGPAEGVRRVAGRVEAHIASLRPPAAVITNPPRTGMDEAAVTALAASSARRIAYVSCDPATLARDLSRLGDRWAIRSLQAFDLFPQTAHIETLTVLEAV